MWALGSDDSFFAFGRTKKPWCAPAQGPCFGGLEIHIAVIAFVFDSFGRAEHSFPRLAWTVLSGRFL